jgi:hypothetical protein
MRATAGQKAGQQGAARRRITRHLELANIKKALQTQSFCIEDGTIGTLTILTQVPPRGVEQRDQTSGKSETPVQGGTVCGTADAQNPPLDPQLQLLIEAWPTLSKEVQQQIMLLVG